MCGMCGGVRCDGGTRPLFDSGTMGLNMGMCRAGTGNWEHM